MHISHVSTDKFFAGGCRNRVFDWLYRLVVARVVAKLLAVDISELETLIFEQQAGVPQ